MPLAKKHTISRSEALKAGGNTWFNCSEEDDLIVFDTREHGDVGGENPGKADLQEARRLANDLSKKFPKHEIRLDAVDEWVIVELRRTPKSALKLREEALIRKTKALGKKWSEPVQKALDKIEEACLGPDKGSSNHAKPFHWTESVVPGKDGKCSTTFSTKYGVRHLYRDHLEALPPFENSEQSREQIQQLAAFLGGTVKNERVTQPYKKTTYNYSPPGNVIEEVGRIEYELELPASVPMKPRDRGGVSKVLPKGKTSREIGTGKEPKGMAT